MAGSNAVGRPTKLEPEVVTKLTAAFANGFTVEQACQYAEISKQTYYRWLEEHPQFNDDMENARNMLGLQARKVVADRINAKDVQTAKWWLEKRDPEFSAKAEIIHKVNPVDEILKQFGLLDEPEAKRITQDTST